jgi:hypothetical protein
MQPQYQIEIDPYSIPEMEICKTDSDDFMNRLSAFHGDTLVHFKH